MNTKAIVDEATKWISNWFENNGQGCNAVIGISGGKDSSVTAALCVRALGKNRVKGILLPNGTQSDIEYAYKLVDHLGIEHFEINIKEAFDGVVGSFPVEMSEQTKVNLAPRLRMSIIYAMSQSLNGRVVNTCNLSEDWIGYSTRYGDSVGDLSPLSHLTVTEVKEIGRYLNLPEELVDKAPSDGLCGKTDEDNIGFTYAVLDKYIRTGICDDPVTKEKIDKRHDQNLFKLELMQSYEPSKEYLS
ncbi:MAG: NAD(+) synthase [Lachnospiraceae bacterium]|nr:NAD(+) synthase [Lachnospiraceae bacterium]